MITLGGIIIGLIMILIFLVSPRMTAMFTIYEMLSKSLDVEFSNMAILAFIFIGLFMDIFYYAWTEERIKNK